MENLVKVLLFISCGVTLIECRGSGAPTSVCTSMTPAHGNEQEGTVPYMIEIQDGVTTYTPGGSKVKVMVSGSQDFAGLLLQARKVGGTTPLGSFAAPDASTNTKLITCKNAGDAVTHSSKDDKNNLTFTWTPPSSADGDIEFVATVAESKQIWWLNVKSAGIKKAGGGGGSGDGGGAGDGDNHAANLTWSALLAAACFFMAFLRV